MAIIEIARKLARTQDAIPPLCIRSSDEISSIFRGLIKEAESLEVARDSRVTVFYSNRMYSISSYKRKQALVIDAVLPRDKGEHVLKTSEFLEIGFRLKGQPYTFRSSFLALGDEDGSTVIISYPELLHIHQFRTASRFFITLDQPQIFVNVDYHQTERSIKYGVGLVKDVSIDGLSFTTNDKKMKPGKDIRLEIGIPDQENIETKASVKNLTFVGHKDYNYICGICFENLSNNKKRVISSFLQDLKKRMSALDKNVYSLERVKRIAFSKVEINAKLEGREITKEEYEDIEDLMDFEKMDLEKTMDL